MKKQLMVRKSKYHMANILKKLIRDQWSRGSTRKSLERKDKLSVLIDDNTFYYYSILKRLRFLILLF